MIIKFPVEVLGEEYGAIYLTGYKHIEKYSQRRYDEDGIIGFDIETYANPAFPYMPKASGLLPALSFIRTIQVYEGNTVRIFDMMQDDGSNGLEDPDSGYFDAIYSLLLRAKEIRSHNALFETAHIQKYAYRAASYMPLNIKCSMNAYRLLVHSLYSARNRSMYKADLKTVAQVVLGYEISKDEQTSDWSRPELSEEQLIYSARDAVLPYLIVDALTPALEDNKMETVYQLNTNAQEAIAHMQIHGINMDTATHKKLIKEWKKETEKHKEACFKFLNQEIEDISPELIWEAVCEGVPEDITDCLSFASLEFSDLYSNTLRTWHKEATELYNSLEKNDLIKRGVKRLINNLSGLFVSVDSGKQVGEWLQRNLSEEDIDNWPKTAKGALKTDAFTFSEAEGFSSVAPIKDYKKMSKLLSTYGPTLAKWFVGYPDGSILLHPSFSLCQTTTGRMSSFKPNVQNIPSKGDGKKIRSIFTARKGRRIVCADFSQIELRIAACLSKDPVLLKAYEQGIDIHRLTASNVAGVPLDQVDDDSRSYAKAMNFALIYGGGGATLKNYAKKVYGIEMTLERAKELVSIFRETYEVFYEWQREQGYKGEKTLMATTPLGKLRKLDSQDYYCTAINHPDQGGAAELMLLSLVFLMEEITKPKYLGKILLVNVVHDEIQLDVVTKYVEYSKTLLRRSMEKAMTVVFPDATLKDLVSVKDGNNWLEAK